MVSDLTYGAVDGSLPLFDMYGTVMVRCDAVCDMHYVVVVHMGPLRLSQMFRVGDISPFCLCFFWSFIGYLPQCDRCVD